MRRGGDGVSCQKCTLGTDECSPGQAGRGCAAAGGSTWLPPCGGIGAGSGIIAMQGGGVGASKSSEGLDGARDMGALDNRLKPCMPCVR